MEEQRKIGFSLIDINTDQFAILDNNFQKGKEAQIDFVFEFKLNSLNKIIACFVGYEFRYGKQTFMKIEVSCHFKITNDTWKELIKGNEIICPKEFLVHLCVITVGTSRGVIYSKTQDSSISAIVLPTLDIRNVIQEDIEFVLIEE